MHVVIHKGSSCRTQLDKLSYRCQEAKIFNERNKQTKELPVFTIIIIKILCASSANWKAFVADNVEIEPNVSTLLEGSVRQVFPNSENCTLSFFLVKISYTANTPLHL